MKQIKIESLKEACLEGIGKPILVKADTVPDDQSPMQTYYGKLGVFKNIGDLQAGFCIAKKRPLILDKVEQHQLTEEVLMALKGDFLVAAIPVDEKTGEPDCARARAFAVEQGEGILFNKGVWHWTPFPQGEEATVLVLFKEDTPAKDFTAFTLAEEIELTE